MRLLKCFHSSVSYLWSDVSLPFRTAPPSRPPQPLGSFLPPKSRAAWLLSTLFWEPSHHAHGYFSSKFISSYLYESLLCQLVCIAYFDYKIKYLTNSSVFHHHHHHPLLHPSFWLVGAKGWVFSQVPRWQQGGTFGRSSLTAVSTTSAPLFSVGTNKSSSHTTFYWVKLPESLSKSVVGKSFRNHLRGSQLPLGCCEVAASLEPGRALFALGGWGYLPGLPFKPWTWGGLVRGILSPPQPASQASRFGLVARVCSI